MSSVLPQPSNPTASISAAETAAAVSAAAAANSAGVATTQAGIATTKAGQAAASAAAALVSEGIATGAAGTATTQAGIATTQAGIATTQAGIATTKAGEAASSAAAADVSEANAQGWAGDAQAYAGTATTQAGIATTKAGEASASAAAALVSEQNAAATLAGSVRFDTAQPGITPAQQAQARINIGVVTAGGVALAGSTAVSSGNGYAASIPVSDFELVVFAKRNDATLTKSAIAGSGNNDYLLIGASLENPGWSGLAWKNAGTQQQLTPDFDQTKPFVASFVKSGSTLTGYVNGVAGGTPATVSAFVSIDRIGGGIIGGYGQFGGDVHAAYIFNRALTSDERAAVMRGEVPAALAAAAAQVPNGTWFGNGTIDPLTGNTAAGFTQNKTTASWQFIASSTTVPVVAGGRYRVTFNQTLPAVSQAFFNGSGNNESNTAVNFSGSGNMSFEMVAAATEVVGFNLKSSAAFTGNYTVSGFSITRIGTVARYEPDAVTSLGRWLDSSGNGYDLIPGAGITPLKPQPVQTRGVTFRYNLATSTATDAPSGWSFVKIGTGALVITPPAYVYARKPPVVSANGEINGSALTVVTTNVNQTTGAITVTEFQASGAVFDGVVSGIVSHLE